MNSCFCHLTICIDTMNTKSNMINEHTSNILKYEIVIVISKMFTANEMRDVI